VIVNRINKVQKLYFYKTSYLVFGESKMKNKNIKNLCLKMIKKIIKDIH
jgi:hypothetical protein